MTFSSVPPYSEVDNIPPSPHRPIPRAAAQSALAVKMSAIMGSVPKMIKNGNNVAQHYSFVTAEDVKATIRPLLKKHGVALFSEMHDIQRATSTNKNGTTVVTVVVRMRFTLVDGESGESFSCEWIGEANDYADKAVNKAATAAEKYWLINTFLLSTSEVLQDADEISISIDESIRLASVDVASAVRQQSSPPAPAQGTAKVTRGRRRMTEGEIASMEEFENITLQTLALYRDNYPAAKDRKDADILTGLYKRARVPDNGSVENAREVLQNLKERLQEAQTPD
jgi:hypothetical protein